MEVILREYIEKLGVPGDVVKVADGYARNFLLPRRMAVAATEANKKIVEQERQKYLKREATLKAEAEELAGMMGDLAITIEHKAGDQEQLFGSVTARNIADALAKQGHEIDHRKIVIDSPIRQLGEYKVAVKLHREVKLDVAVTVIPEGGYPEPAEEPEAEAAEGVEAAEAGAEEAVAEEAAAEEAVAADTPAEEADEAAEAAEETAEEPKAE
jgi:large subunit ribosomal protein L9